MYIHTNNRKQFQRLLHDFIVHKSKEKKAPRATKLFSSPLLRQDAFCSVPESILRCMYTPPFSLYLGISRQHILFVKALRTYGWLA